VSLTPKVMVVVRDLSAYRAVKIFSKNIFYTARILNHGAKSVRPTNDVKRVEL
jgi:hypothetical protein